MACEACGSSGETEHHIHPKWAGGSDAISNKVHICRACHDLIDDGRPFTYGRFDAIRRNPTLVALLAARLFAEAMFRKVLVQRAEGIVRHARRMCEKRTPKERRHFALKLVKAVEEYERSELELMKQRQRELATSKEPA